MAFLALFVLAVPNCRRSIINIAFVFACFTTFVWEGAEAGVAWYSPDPDSQAYLVLRLLDTVRTVA